MTPMAVDISQISTFEKGALRPAEHRPVDEHANLITHGLGLVLSLLASGLLMTLVSHRQHTINIVACGTYCASMIGVYAASTFSHMFYDLAWRRFFRALDGKSKSCYRCAGGVRDYWVHLLCAIRLSLPHEYQNARKARRICPRIYGSFYEYWGDDLLFDEQLWAVHVASAWVNHLQL